MGVLTREERGRMVNGFLMTSGGIALAMVLFALIGQIDTARFILTVVGTVMVLMASPVLWLFGQPARVVYGMAVTGLGAIVGAHGGSFIINTVITALH